MLNFKLISFHFKQIWIILGTIGISALLLVLSSILGGHSFSPLSRVSDSSVSTTGGVGSFFAPMIIGGTMALSFVMIIILLYKLFSKEIDQSYIGIWLTLPISRQKVIFSKLFVIFISIVIFHTDSIVCQLIIYGSLMKDFNAKIAFTLLGTNGSMIFISLLFASITWLLINLISKQSLALTIASTLAALSIIFYIMANANSDSANPFHALQYITILIFVTNPLQFDYAHPIKEQIPNTTEWWQYYPVLTSSKNLVWQIPVPIIIIPLPLMFGVSIFKNKNLSI